MSKILVTGATGFVGQALCARMLDEGGQVRGTIRSMKQMDSLPTRIESVCIESIAYDTDWSAALNGVDIVVHLAAREHIMKESDADSIEAFREINVIGTERLARMAAAVGVRRFVFLSSVKVNGEGKATPYTEHDEVWPKDPYGVSKWEAEQALQKVVMETGLEVVILRPPLAYGPRVKANFLSLLQIVSSGIPLPLKSIINRRSFIYLGNLVDAIVTCVNHPHAAGQTYLVSDDEDISTPELLRRVASALDRPARLIPFPPALLQLSGRLFGKSGSVERLLGSLSVDISKIRNELNWTPPYTMRQGLKKTAAWFIGNCRQSDV